MLALIQKPEIGPESSIATPEVGGIEDRAPRLKGQTPDQVGEYLRTEDVNPIGIAWAVKAAKDLRRIHDSGQPLPRVKPPVVATHITGNRFYN